MGPRSHGPSELRSFLRRLKEHQGSFDGLLRDAEQIADPANGAAALAAIAARPEMPPVLRERALDSLLDRLRGIQREMQVAEIVPAVMKELGPQSDTQTMRQVVDRLLRLPDGEALSAGLRAAAKTAPTALRPLLFERAVHNHGAERDDAKAVLRAAFNDPQDLVEAEAWRGRIATLQDPDLRIRLAAFLHHQVSRIERGHPMAHAAMEDVVRWLEETTGLDGPPERGDLWRTVARDAAGPDALRPLIAVAGKEPPVEQADALLALGAQADRSGDQELAKNAFDTVARVLDAVPGAHTERLARKLETARSRMGGAKPTAPKRETSTAPPSTRPSAEARTDDRPPPATGHALALCNTYTGGIKATHFRAIARAAPLCAAYGLDLVLLGFPVPLDELVARTARETRIGGRPWIIALHDAGRVRAGSLDPSEDRALLARYTWVATSERTRPDEQSDLGTLTKKGPVCLVMGIGPKGLPERVLRTCASRYEITGSGIGLETATAMGILADRLARAAREQK